MAKDHILVVEDEEEIQELVHYNLTREGYRVTCASSGEEGLRLARSSDVPDLIVLDLMLPGMDGFEVCKALRGDTRTAPIPIVMLTAKSEDADLVTGFELGADDYVTKPFSPRVLLARTKAALRRRDKRESAPADGPFLKLHGIVIEPGRHAVRVDGKPIELTLTEFRILHLLARRPGWVFSRDQIIEAIRGEDYPVTNRSVDVHIASLRKKLGASGRHLDTVRGVGYRMEAE